MSESPARRIAIAYPHANLDTVPSLVGAAEQFAQHGYAVDIYTHTVAGQPPPRFQSERIRVRSLGVEGLAEHSTAGLRSVLRRAGWLPPAARAPLARGYAALGAGLAQGSRLVARAHAESGTRYACVIGVDPDGLDLAARIARGAPLGYYSLELLLSYELRTPAERALKASERNLSRQAAFIVVQDAARGRLLADDNSLAWDRLVLVPNSPPGPARRQPAQYWHTRFGLAPEQRVVLHAGSLGDWTGIDAILASVATWPPEWILVIHTRYDAQSSTYVDELRAGSDPRRVFWSLKPLARQAYDAIVDAADVGLGFYVSTGESAFTQRNVQVIGLSSGKLAYYLRAGLPVIVNRAASVADQLDAAGCGIAVADAGSIGPALSGIAADYSRFSAAALDFFNTHLDFERAFDAVIARVDGLVAASLERA